MSNLLSWKKNIPILKSERNPFSSVQRALDKAMNEFYDFFDRSPITLKSFEELAINPSIDIVEDKENFKAEVEMPGMGENDIKVSIDGNMLTIKGEKKTSRQDKDKNYLSREISYGYYERAIPLPEGVDADKAKASFKKGMLWVALPKKPEFKKSGRELKIEKMKE